nr:hypothetical protein [Candidatus Sigynarchaeota archaeon]
MTSNQYEKPRLLSAREGFSADHSHECEGCPICGAFGAGPSLDECEICNARPEETDDTEYCEFCDVRGDDFCQLIPSWCWNHHRALKFVPTPALLRELKEALAPRFEELQDDETEFRRIEELLKEPAKPVELGICMGCWNEIANFFRYCHKCKKSVIANEAKTCNFCGNATFEDVPDVWL